MLVRGNGEDVKISLDCMRQPPRPEEVPVPRKTVMIFVAIYIVRKKQIQEIMTAEYDTVG